MFVFVDAGGVGECAAAVHSYFLECQRFQSIFSDFPVNVNVSGRSFSVSVSVI